MPTHQQEQEEARQLARAARNQYDATLRGFAWATGSEDSDSDFEPPIHQIVRQRKRFIPDSELDESQENVPQVYFDGSPVVKATQRPATPPRTATPYPSPTAPARLRSSSTLSCSEQLDLSNDSDDFEKIDLIDDEAMDFVMPPSPSLPALVPRITTMVPANPSEFYASNATNTVVTHGTTTSYDTAKPVIKIAPYINTTEHAHARGFEVEAAGTVQGLIDESHAKWGNKPRKKIKRFRLQGKRFLLTYPRCDRDPNELVELIKKHYAEAYEYAVVCKELHKDGTPHIHAVVGISASVEYSKPDCFDWVCGQHGNYGVVRNLRKSLAYVIKDGKWVANGIDVHAIIGKKKGSGQFLRVVEKLMGGTAMTQLEDADMPIVAMHKRKLEEFSTWYKLKNAPPKVPWPGTLYLKGPSAEGRLDMIDIVKWLNQNIKKERPFKQAQLYLQGPTNSGKTSLIIWLSQYLRVYQMPLGEDFVDDYNDDLFDLIVFDEFRGQRTITDMNVLLQGDPTGCPLRRKGSQVVKKKNLPIIILSNFSPREAYHKVAETQPGILAPFVSRLWVVVLMGFINTDDIFWEVK